jgi:hypothetical protein
MASPSPDEANGTGLNLFIAICRAPRSFFLAFSQTPVLIRRYLISFHRKPRIAKGLLAAGGPPQEAQTMAGSITNDVHRWQNGDHHAQFDLERDLRPFLLQLIRGVGRRLDTPLKARIDSHGVVYAALHSFLTGVRKHEFPVLDNRNHVKKVLNRLVDRTLIDAIRWNQRDRRTPQREEPSANGVPRHLPAPADLVPVAEDIAAWLEKLEAVLRPAHKKAITIMELSLKGLANADIARQLRLGLRSVEVIKQKMRAHWEAAAGGED